MSRRTRRNRGKKAEPAYPEVDLARMGDGQVAYIRELSPREARRMFPTIKGLPSKGILFALHAADGTPLKLADTLQAAQGYAKVSELEISAVH